MKSIIKNIFRMSLPLPVKYDTPHNKSCDQPLFTSFGLKRSGQHLIIDWICRGLNDALHLNHCRFFRIGFSVVLTPKTGRRVIYSAGNIDDSGMQGRQSYRDSLPVVTPANLFYSLEDMSLNHPDVKKLLRKFHSVRIIILRDPANWLASSIMRGKLTNGQLMKRISIMKEYLKYANDLERNGDPSRLAVNFNLFTQDKRYRVSIAERLQLSSFERAEEALQHIPAFGGGSSFKDEGGESDNTQNRWLEFQDDDFFQSALRDRELIDLAQGFFGVLPGIPTAGQ